jgi:hypothetical protein
MAEDSGAFKTNPANSRPVPAFVIISQCRCREASPIRKRAFEYEWRIHRDDF